MASVKTPSIEVVIHIISKFVEACNQSLLKQYNFHSMADKSAGRSSKSSAKFNQKLWAMLQAVLKLLRSLPFC